MSYFKGVGNGSNSYGQFWFGGSSFPGFLYKKNTGVGGRKNPKYGLICNKPTTLWNTYTPGSGVGASNISNRRSKMIKSSNCSNGGGCSKTNLNLGLFKNPLSYYPYPSIPRYEILGEYSFLPSEPGFNTVIRFTGVSTFIVNYAPIEYTTEIYVNDVLTETFVLTVQPAAYPVPAGVVDSDTIIIILKFNV
jgi:hypothetical protein